MEALWIWRQFPRQIASDLSQYHNRRIAQWHAGEMSSYELLELLEWMPERGAFKTSARGGEYSEEEIVWRHIANRLSNIESITYVQASGKKGEPIRMFPTVAEQLETAEDMEAAEERREDFFSFADMNPAEIEDKIVDTDLEWEEVV